MSNTYAGGPAFPNSEERFSDGTLREEAQPGMTLRDYFAAKALLGLMGRSRAESSTGKLPANLHNVWATAAYQMADAMLKARGQ